MECVEMSTAITTIPNSEALESIASIPNFQTRGVSTINEFPGFFGSTKHSAGGCIGVWCFTLHIHSPFKMMVLTRDWRKNDKSDWLNAIFRRGIQAVLIFKVISSISLNISFFDVCIKLFFFSSKGNSLVCLNTNIWPKKPNFALTVIWADTPVLCITADFYWNAHLLIAFWKKNRRFSVNNLDSSVATRIMFIPFKRFIFQLQISCEYFTAHLNPRASTLSINFSW